MRGRYQPPRSEHLSRYVRFVLWRRRVEQARGRVWAAERAARREALFVAAWLLVAFGELVAGRMTPLRVFTLAALGFMIGARSLAAWTRVRSARREVARREAEQWKAR